MAATGARAQGTEQAGTFAKELVAAINSKSMERRKALLHPKSLACASAGSAYDESSARQARRTVPANYNWKITPVPAGQPPMFADKFDYPVNPTHLLQIDFETGPARSTTMILQVVYEGNRWREVTACAKPETAAAAAQVAKQDRAKRSERVKSLVAGTAPQLKETVVKLFKEGRRIDAYKHYAAASGEDLAMAKEVVEQLAR